MNNILMSGNSLITISIMIGIALSYLHRYNKRRKFPLKTIEDVIKEAISKPTLHEAIVEVCVWENNRIIHQALRTDDEEWESCFNYLVQRVIETYLQTHQLTIISLKDQGF